MGYVIKSDRQLHCGVRYEVRSTVALWGTLLSQIDSCIERFVCSLFVEIECVHWGEYFFPRVFCQQLLGLVLWPEEALIHVVEVASFAL